MTEEQINKKAEEYAHLQYGNSCGAKEERKHCIEDYLSGYNACLEDNKELLKQAFEAAREYNSIDGIVDINIVLNMPKHDLSDLDTLYPNFEDWYKTII